MTTTPPEAPSGPAAGAGDEPGHEGPRVTRDEIRDLGRLRRSATDRKVAGVAGGLARHLDVDPLVLRVAFVVLVFFGGAGLLLYGACWLLLPDERTGRAPVSLDERSRSVALLVVGVLAALALVGDSWGVFGFPWPLAIVALVALLVLTRRDREQPPPGSGGAPYAPYAPPADSPGGETGPTAAYRPRDSRRRGPILFWFTLALTVLGVGVLGLVDVAGVGVADSAYPALITAVIGVMLLLGAFWGRAGGLIAIGLVAAVAMGAATAAGNFDGETLHETPSSAAEVEHHYDFGAGEVVLDLTEVADLEGLDGRTIEIEGGAGEIEVIVPDGIDLRFEGRVGGPGNVEFFGQDRGGIATEVLRTREDGDVDLTVDAQLGIGTITVDER